MVLLATSCGQNKEPAQDIGDSHQQLETSAVPAVVSDGTSLPALTIYWQGAESEREGNGLTAVAQNTTKEALLVEFSLLGVAPTSDTVVREFGSRHVPANSSEVLRVSISDLPVQSVGVASSVTLVGRYPIAKAQFAPEDAKQAEPVELVAQAFTPAMYVDLDASAEMAHFRVSRAEAHSNASNRGRGSMRLERLKIFDPATGQLVDATPSVQGPGRDVSKPIVQVVEGTRGSKTLTHPLTAGQP